MGEVLSQEEIDNLLMDIGDLRVDENFNVKRTIPQNNNTSNFFEEIKTMPNTNLNFVPKVRLPKKKLKNEYYCAHCKSKLKLIKLLTSRKSSYGLYCEKCKYTWRCPE